MVLSKQEKLNQLIKKLQDVGIKIDWARRFV